MSDQPPEFNPYQPASGPIAQSGDEAFLTRTTREMARWQTFFAVLMTLGILAMIGMFAITVASGAGDLSAAIGGMTCVGGITLLLYGLPAIMLWKAAAGARKYSKTPGRGELAEFASSQLSFWRTIGIIAAIVMGLYAVILVGAMMFGMSAALNQ